MRYQVYIAHLQQLIWLSTHRKGMLLIELPLLDAFSSHSNLKKPAKEFKQTLQKFEAEHNSNNLESNLACLSIFPSYIHLFNPIANNQTASQFDTAWKELEEYYWPSHINNRHYFATFSQLETLIPSFIDWHNQLIGQSVAIVEKGDANVS